MPYFLSAEEVRVLGCLIEKEKVTPETYPLSMNALVSACNQKSSRDPVVEYSEATVQQALDSLRAHGLARFLTGPEMRVAKYRHLLPDALQLSPREEAVLCVLFLRGPQTSGEIRTRSGRLYEFRDLAEVEETLAELQASETRPLITKLPRQPGAKESRYAHLFSGLPVAEATSAPGAESTPVRTPDRIENLETEVAALRLEVEDLRKELSAFRKQFE